VRNVFTHCCSAAGSTAEEAAEDAAGVDHGAAQGSEPGHAGGRAGGAGDRLLPACASKPAVEEVTLRPVTRQQLVASCFTLQARILAAAVVLTNDIEPENWQRVLQVDPVFEGADGGQNSLVKYNPLSNVSSAEVWNFLRVMVRLLNPLLPPIRLATGAADFCSPER